MKRKLPVLLLSTLLITLASMSASCGGDGAWQIMKQDPTWMAQITRINVGPDEYYEGDYKYGPQKDGEGFVWVYLTLNNQTSSPMEWDHTKVILKSETASQDPFRVLKSDGVNQSPVKAKERIAPGSYAERILIYSFPRAAQPAVIEIGPLGNAEVPESILFQYK